MDMFSVSLSVAPLEHPAILVPLRLPPATGGDSSLNRNGLSLFSTVDGVFFVIFCVISACFCVLGFLSFFDLLSLFGEKIFRAKVMIRERISLPGLLRKRNLPSYRIVVS